MDAGAGFGLPTRQTGQRGGRHDKEHPMLDFLKFETLIAPLLIQIVFWLAVIFCLVVGIISMLQGELGGLALFLLGPIAARLYAEFFIVFFRMNDHLRLIQVNTTPR
jgi:uncharacterized protein DUF4282